MQSLTTLPMTLQMVVLRGFYVVYCLKFRIIFHKIKNFRSKIEAAGENV
jgi:hypothetical protein